MTDNTDQAIDREIHNAVPYGAISKLARFRNVAVQSIAKYYDPNCEQYRNVFAEALSELRVIARNVSPHWAASILGVFNRFGSEWCGNAVPLGECNVLEEIIVTAAKLNNPATPFAERPALTARLKRLADAVESGQRFEAAEPAEV